MDIVTLFSDLGNVMLLLSSIKFFIVFLTVYILFLIYDYYVVWKQARQDVAEEERRKLKDLQHDQMDGLFLHKEAQVRKDFHAD